MSGGMFLITRLAGNFDPLVFLALTYDDRLDFGDIDPYRVHINSYTEADAHTPYSIARVELQYYSTIPSLPLKHVLFFFLSSLDVSDRIADPLPVPGGPSCWHFPVGLFSSPLTPEQPAIYFAKRTYCVRTNPR